MPPLGKRKRPSAASSSLPITAFFERKKRAQASSNNAFQSALEVRNAVEEIEDDADSVDCEVTVVATLPPSEPTERSEISVLNTAHLTRLLHRRELGSLARGVPSSTAARRRQQIDQRLARHALMQFRLLPLQLAIPYDAVHAVLANRLVAQGDEFYASALAFDSQGALLVAGSSNGIIALFDCDDLFHRTINLQQSESERPRVLLPIHLIYSGMEVQRLRWNPANEDEIACSFLNRNEIHVYNLQKFPTKPQLVLKTTSRPSSGYTDLLFLRPSVAAHGSKMKQPARGSTIIAGDIDGNLRAWDLRFPTKPLWAVSTSSHALTALALSHDEKLLLCGTEGGVIMTYDIHHLIVPAFGSRPMPPRKAVVRLADAIRACLPTEAAAVLKHAQQATGSIGTLLAIASLHYVPSSTTQVVVQLRNQWLIVLDISTGTVLKLHTPVKELRATRSVSHGLPASVLHSAAEELSTQQQQSALGQRHSWLHLHRCTATLLFHGGMMCAGIPSEPELSIVDLHRLDLLAPYRTLDQPATLPLSNYVDSLPVSPPNTVERLSRFRIDTAEPVTAVAVHPTQHWIVCGGANLRLRVLSASGSTEVDTTLAEEKIAT